MEEIKPIVAECTGDHACIDRIVTRMMNQAGEWRTAGTAGWSQREYHAGIVCKQNGLKVRANEIWQLIADRAERADWRSLALVELSQSTRVADPAVSIARLEQAVALLDSSADGREHPIKLVLSLMELGNALRRAGRNDEAVERYLRVYNHPPNYQVTDDLRVMAARQIAEIRVIERRVPESAAMVDRVLADYPEYCAANGLTFQLRMIGAGVRGIGEKGWSLGIDIERLRAILDDPSFEETPQVMSAHEALAYLLAERRSPELKAAADRAVRVFHERWGEWRSRKSEDVIRRGQLDDAERSYASIDMKVVSWLSDEKKYAEAAQRCAEHLARLPNSPNRNGFESTKENMIWCQQVTSDPSRSR